MPLHPAIVHLPLGLAFALPWIALWSGVLLLRGSGGRGSWGLLVSLQALVVAGALGAAASGDTDAELARRFVDPARIEEHEAGAQLFIACAVASTIAGFVTLRRLGKPGLRLAIGATLLLSLLTASLGLRVGHAGGLLVYELGAANAHRAPRSAAPRSPEPAPPARNREPSR